MKKRKLRRGRIFGAFLIILLVVFVVGILVKVSYYSGLKAFYPVRYSEYVDKYCEEYKVDKALMYSIIKNESGFDPNAKSSVDAVGLTQLMPETIEWLSGKTGENLNSEALYDPEISIKYGAYLISILQNEFEETETLIAAYHAGIGEVGRWLHNPEYTDDGKTLKKIPFDDTRLYVKRVTKSIEIYNKIYYF